MITSQGFGIGALVNVDKYYNKSLGMIVRQSRGYNWVVKRMNDGQNVLAHEDNMEVVSAARLRTSQVNPETLSHPARYAGQKQPRRCD